MGTLLPVVQFLQKNIQRHLDDVSKLYVMSPGGREQGGFHCRQLVQPGSLPMLSDLGSKGPRVGLTDTSPMCPHSCDWNRYNLQYALAVSKQRGLKRPSEPPGSGEEADASEDDDDSLHLLGGGPGHADGPLA